MKILQFNAIFLCINLNHFITEKITCDSFAYLHLHPLRAFVRTQRLAIFKERTLGPR